MQICVGRVHQYPPDYLIQITGDRLEIFRYEAVYQNSPKCCFELADPDFPEKVWAVIRNDFRDTIKLWAGLITPACRAYHDRFRPSDYREQS